jgi:O-6-methylguanine DNA methyltransferase
VARRSCGANRRWLICSRSWKETWHQQWLPGRLTWLFFYDEAVALAAGHRPCALCRRPAYNAYRAAWAAGGRAPSHDEMDRQLHCERVISEMRRRARTGQHRLPAARVGTAQQIPYGQTTIYGQLARHFTNERGKWVEPQAVAGAVARTPIPIIIPCHRVIGADGSLRGYVGGLQRKQKLLDFEASHGDTRALGEAWRDRQLMLI